MFEASNPFVIVQWLYIVGVNAFSEYSIRGQSLNHCSTVRHLWRGGENLLYKDIHVYVYFSV